MRERRERQRPEEQQRCDRPSGMHGWRRLWGRGRPVGNGADSEAGVSVMVTSSCRLVTDRSHEVWAAAVDNHGVTQEDQRAPCLITGSAGCPGAIHIERFRVATPLELLFDLTFVVGFGVAASEFAHTLSENHVGAGLLAFVFATFAVWWAWINFSWFASAYDTDDWVYRLTTMVQMVGVIILALGLPQTVRVGARRPSRRQPHHGRRICGDADRDGGPVVAGRQTGSGSSAGVPDLRRQRDRRPDRLGGSLLIADTTFGDHAGVRLPVDRRRAARAVDRRNAQGRYTLARPPHRGTVRVADDHRAR